MVNIGITKNKITMCSFYVLFVLGCHDKDTSSPTIKSQGLSSNESIALNLSRNTYINDIHNRQSNPHIEIHTYREELRAALSTEDTSYNEDDLTTLIDTILWRRSYTTHFHELYYILITKLQASSSTVVPQMIASLQTLDPKEELHKDIMYILSDISGPEVYSYMRERLLSPLPDMPDPVPVYTIVHEDGTERVEAAPNIVEYEYKRRLVAIRTFYKCYKASKDPLCRDVLVSVLSNPEQQQGLRKLAIKYLYNSGETRESLESLSLQEDHMFIGPFIGVNLDNNTL